MKPAKTTRLRVMKAVISAARETAKRRRTRPMLAIFRMQKERAEAAVSRDMLRSDIGKLLEGRTESSYGSVVAKVADKIRIVVGDPSRLTKKFRKTHPELSAACDRVLAGMRADSIEAAMKVTSQAGHASPELCGKIAEKVVSRATASEIVHEAICIVDSRTAKRKLEAFTAIHLAQC